VLLVQTAQLPAHAVQAPLERYQPIVEALVVLQVVQVVRLVQVLQSDPQS